MTLTNARRRRIRLLPALLALALTGYVLLSGRAESVASDGLCAVPVRTESGLVKGISDRETSTCSWRGIPYAAAPVGELRWRPPQPPPTWTEVRDGSKWGGRCMQANGFILRQMSPDPSGKMGEDCLFLNVWRPRAEGKFPVMVLVPGGGFGLGSGNMPGYWGDRLAERGEVVVVSFNYRLGMLGFLALPGLRDEDEDGSTGNYGLLDQIAALEWVQRNIAEFGGDPEDVTLIGQSAGGWSVCTLIASPKAEGLFNRAIMESGGCSQVQTLEEGFQQGEAFANQLGCEPGDLDCLRGLPARRVQKQTRLPSWTGFAYGPHVDGDLLTGKPIELLRTGATRQVPWIVGSNRDELSFQLLAAARHLNGTPASEYAAAIADTFPISPEQTAELMEAYPLGDFEDEPLKAFQRMATDIAFGCPTYESAMAASAVGVPTYYYRFDYTDFRLAGMIGATHGIEMPFVFDSFDRRAFGMFFSRAMARRARPLASSMQSYWLNFAKTGDPNGSELPRWDRFDPAAPKAQVLDQEIRPGALGQERRCAFWRRYPMTMGW